MDIPEEQNDISVSSEQLITQITNDIQKHDKKTGYKITDDMLAPYMDNDLLKSEPNNQMVKTLLKNNRLLLYLDQYYTTLKYLTDKKKTETESICSIDDLLNRNIFDLSTLQNILTTEIPSSQNIDSLTQIQTRYTNQLSEKLKNSSQAIKDDVEELKNKNLIYIDMHGEEQYNLFIVPQDVIICKIASYNYVLARTIIKDKYTPQMMNLLKEYTEGKIFTQNCCNNNDLMNFYFPGQICNDTKLKSVKEDKVKDFAFNKEVFKLLSNSEIVENKSINFIDKESQINATTNEIYLKDLVCKANMHISNSIIIIGSCRTQILGTPSSYTEFNYRLEKIQTYINNLYCICSSQPDNFPTRLLRIFFPKTKETYIGEIEFNKKYSKENQFIWDLAAQYSPFYDTFLSTPINTHKHKNKHRKITISEVINNKAILKLYSHTDIEKLLYKLTNSTFDYYINTREIKLENIQAIIYLIIYMINEDININYIVQFSNLKKGQNSVGKEFKDFLVKQFITILNNNQTMSINKENTNLVNLCILLLIYRFEKKDINYFILLMNIINTLYNRFPKFINKISHGDSTPTTQILNTIYFNIAQLDDIDIINVGKLICSIRYSYEETEIYNDTYLIDPIKNNKMSFIDTVIKDSNPDVKEKIDKMINYYYFETNLIFIDLSK